MRGTKSQTIGNAHFYTFHSVTRMVHYAHPRGKLACVCFSFIANVLETFQEIVKPQGHLGFASFVQDMVMITKVRLA